MTRADICVKPFVTVNKSNTRARTHAFALSVQAARNHEIRLQGVLPADELSSHRRHHQALNKTNRLGQHTQAQALTVSTMPVCEL